MSNKVVVKKGSNNKLLIEVDSSLSPEEQKRIRKETRAKIRLQREEKKKKRFRKSKATDSNPGSDREIGDSDMDDNIRKPEVEIKENQLDLNPIIETPKELVLESKEEKPTILLEKKSVSEVQMREKNEKRLSIIGKRQSLIKEKRLSFIKERASSNNMKEEDFDMDDIELTEAELLQIREIEENFSDEEEDSKIEPPKRRISELDLLRDENQSNKQLENEKYQQQEREKELKIKKLRESESKRIKEYEEKMQKESAERIKLEKAEKEKELERERLKKEKELKEQEELKKRNEELLLQEQKKLEEIRIKKEKELENQRKEEERKRIQQKILEEKKNKQLREQQTKLEEQKTMKIIEELRKQKNSETQILEELLKFKEGDYNDMFEFLHIKNPRKYIYSIKSFKFLSRKLNVACEPPHYIFISDTTPQKGMLIDAVIGVNLFKSLDFKRTVNIHFKYDSAAQDTQYIFMRDNATQSEQLLVENSSSLNKELEKRNVSSTEPLHLVFSSTNFFEITFIYTPSLQNEGSSKVITDLIKQNVSSSLIFVESCPEDWGNDSTLLSNLRRSLDPAGQRSLCVFVAFDRVLDKHYTSKDLASYLDSSPSRSNNLPLYFFLTIPTSIDTSEVTKFSNRELQLVRNERGYVPSHSQQIGVIPLCREIIKRSVSYYKIHILPNISLNVNKEKKVVNENLKDNQKLSGEVKNVYQMRGSVSSYVVRYLQLFNSICEGHIVANPSIYGQSTQEERLRSGNWINEKRLSLFFSHEDVPNFTARLYGIKQIERLLTEFKQVMESIDIRNISQHKLANVQQGGNNPTSLLFSSCQIVQDKVSFLFKPIVNQLLRRAKYIAKRIVYITSNTFISPTTLHSSFLHKAIEVSIENFIEGASRVCSEKFEEEFLCTQLIHFKSGFKMDKNKDDILDKIGSSSTDLLGEMRDVIIENVTLKLYQFFVEPLRENLSQFVQTRVLDVPDLKIKEIFQEETNISFISTEKVTLDEKAVSLKHLETKVLNLLQEFN